MKKIFAVLGTPRSGTSAIARSLKALGVDLGENLTPAKEAWNPKGFWEDTEIVHKINRGVLAAMNYSWKSVDKVEEACQKNKTIAILKQEASALLQKRMTSSDHFGFKDPRTAKILPFWQPIFQQLNLEENYIIAVRNPLASAYSYERVSGNSIEVGLLLWLMHLIPAIDYTQGKKRLMVSYDAMLTAPGKQLERIKAYFGLTASQTEMDAYANDFLDKNLTHFNHSDHDLRSHEATAIIPMCEKMYRLFVRLANDDLDFRSPEFISTWQEIKSEFQRYFPLYCYMDSLLKKNKQLEREMRTMRKSVPWRLMYPLRLIDDALRRLRKSRKKYHLIHANAEW